MNFQLVGGKPEARHVYQLKAWISETHTLHNWVVIASRVTLGRIIVLYIDEFSHFTIISVYKLPQLIVMILLHVYTQNQ